MDQVKDKIPLCVDLDGTIIRTDSLWESIAWLASHSPFLLCILPFWLLRGRSYFKARLAQLVLLRVDLLPYRERVLSYLQEQVAQGRDLFLVSAADESIVSSVAAHLGLFKGYWGSDAGRNLKGKEKASHLVKYFGLNGFDYMGDSPTDMAVWLSARQAILVGGDSALQEDLSKASPSALFVDEDQTVSLWARIASLLRLSQWVKNALLFVPLLTSLSFLDFSLILKDVLAFLLFGLAASSAYMINDFLDVEVDRCHPRKCARPFAAGLVPLWVGFAVPPVFIVSAFLLAFVFLTKAFAFMLVFYVVVTLLYSFWIKLVPVLDVLTLSGLYTLRVVAGAFVIQVPLSFWLFAFSVFIFLSLATLKRYVEVREARDEQGRLSRRGYVSGDALLLRVQGVVTGYLSVLVMALYINSDGVTQLYEQPKFLWGLCPLLLYWVGRLWFLAERGVLPDDPVLFAANDRVTYVSVVFCLAFMALAALPLY